MEVYGEIPQKYTKEWWDYIWYYYKWHILSTVFAVVMIVTCFQQCANRPSYDLQIAMITEEEFYLTQTEGLKSLAESVISDATGNGENEVYILPIHMSDESDATTVQTGFARFTAEMAVPESYVFIVSRHYGDIVLKNEMLESTDVWADGAESDGYLVSLKGNEKLKEIGIDSDSVELYLGVVKLFENRKGDELEKERHENGVRFSRYLLGLE